MLKDERDDCSNVAGVHSEPTYVLGHSAAEVNRLMFQARFLGELTDHLLRRAGIEAGMHVLDLGCGAGDVAFAAARIVGTSGHVIGVDRSREAIEMARSRALSAGIANVTFREADLVGTPWMDPIDALVGRLVLMYLPDPAGVLRAWAERVRVGGVVAFQEMDMSTVRTVPETPLWAACFGWITETFRRGGVELDTGSRLHAIFTAAGLPRPQMLLTGRVESGPDSPVHDYAAHTVRSLLPMTERLGVATAERVQVETLADRLRAAAVAADCAVHAPALVGAWARKLLAR